MIINSFITALFNWETVLEAAELADAAQIASSKTGLGKQTKLTIAVPKLI
jgi:hypothetical protein